SYGPPPAPQPPLAPQSPAAPPSAPQTITGTVTQLNAAAYPAQLTVQTPNGAAYTFRIASGTTITRVTGTSSNAPIPLTDLRAGDAVAVTADPSGTAQSIQALNYTPAPPQASVPGPGQPVAGIVTQVNASSYPGQLSVQMSNGTVATYRIVSATVITRTNTTTGYGGPVPLTSIQPGDAVNVSADPTGTAQSVQVSFAEVSGTVAAAGNNQIALQDGQTFMLGPGAQVTQRGQPVPFAALQPGTAVTLRVNPATGEVFGVVVRQASVPGAVPPAPGAVPPGPVTAPVTPTARVTPADRQFVVGDVLTVTATGPTRGTATFAIAGLRSGLPMTEAPNQPGLYVGNYVVQPGDAAANASVTVSILTPAGQPFTAVAPTSVSIAGVPPAGAPAGAGAAPVITSPAPGQNISTPFTVTGIVAAGSLVRVTADYSKNVIGFNWHGSLGTQTVTADPAGNWSATFTQKPPVLGATVKITAVVVDPAGAVQSPPAIVSTTLQ
ncbi:MAG TPA: hypothetical protein VJT33_15855, partial [bacterium]|nr:hypothetical protein [bacterium]